HQLTAVVSLAGLDRAQDGVAEQPQRLVVLEGEQQLEGAELAVGRDLRAWRRRARAVSVAGRGVGAQRYRLQRTARLVKAPARLAAGHGASGTDPNGRVELVGHVAGHALTQGEQLVLLGPGHERAGEVGGGGDQTAGGLLA